MGSLSDLAEGVWSSKRYYELARQASRELNHPGMRLLARFSRKSQTILDMGCGEGSRLGSLYKNHKECIGIDISSLSIKLAKKEYPNIKFMVADLAEIPLKSNSFDLTYMAFVLEHLFEPEKVIEEAIRLTKKEGYIIFIAPNFGAPNRASPRFKGSRLKKLLGGFITDMNIFKRNNYLDWNKVEPITDPNQYRSDFDTTVEPYIKTLISFLENHRIMIIESTSCWSEDILPKLHQKIFSILGSIGIYPFSMWGPHLVVVGRKINE